MMDNTVKKDVVFDHLREIIISGYFRPGESLSERGIAEMLGVSRTPVREAFRRLENEGIVIYESKKGVTIPSFTKKQLKDLYNVREHMEGLAARLLSEKEDKKRILGEMRANVQEAKMATKENDVKEQALINGYFHKLMAEGTENPYLINIYKTLRSNIGLIRSTSLSYQDRLITNLEEHLQICDAIENGDPDIAEQVARSHVRNSMNSAFSKINMDAQSQHSRWNPHRLT